MGAGDTLMRKAKHGKQHRAFFDALRARYPQDFARPKRKPGILGLVEAIDLTRDSVNSPAKQGENEHAADS